MSNNKKTTITKTVFYKNKKYQNKQVQREFPFNHLFRIVLYTSQWLTSSDCWTLEN